MSYDVSEAVEETKERLRALKWIAVNHPRARHHYYKTLHGASGYAVWEDEGFDPLECDSVELVQDGERRAGVIMFKNLAPGINIGPQQALYLCDAGLVLASLLKDAPELLLKKMGQRK